MKSYMSGSKADDYARMKERRNKRPAPKEKPRTGPIQITPEGFLGSMARKSETVDVNIPKMKKAARLRKDLAREPERRMGASNAASHRQAVADAENMTVHRATVERHAPKKRGNKSKDFFLRRGGPNWGGYRGSHKD